MRVMIIWSNQDYSSQIPFPPIGAKGVVVSDIDEDGDFDVEFDNYPCPVGGETSWVTHKSMVVFLSDEKEKILENELHADINY